MANENKNIKELVSDDDDPTAELEIPGFHQFDEVEDLQAERESDSHTCGLGDSEDSETPRRPTIPELQSDLKSRSKKIGQLQYDIQQLRSKWLGLEAEINAREEIVANLLQDAEKLNGKIERRDKLLKKRSKSLKSLKTEIRQRDKDRLALEEKLAQQELAGEESSSAHATTAQELEAVRGDLEASHSSIASIEATLEQRDEKYALLEQQLLEQEKAATGTTAELEESKLELERLRIELDRAENEQQNLNSEVNRRDELESALEKTNASLEQQLESVGLTEAERAAELQASKQEVARLNLELETTCRENAAQIEQTQKTTSGALREYQAQLEKTEDYADTLRFKFQDSDESLSKTSRQADSLTVEVAALAEQNGDFSRELDATRAANEELLASLDQLEAEHEQEIRTLRFELTEAQESIAQTGDLNTELASDLVSTRNFKEELERMLLSNEEDAQQRIADLEKQVGKLASTSEEFEQKLDTKNTAINVLLGELAKKSEQIESIGEIEEVIQEIDNRMSERFEEPGKNSAEIAASTPIGGDRDRTTRVLVGSIGDQELRFPLFKNRLTIGRTADNDIQLKTSYISRRHAVVLTEGEATRVIDWGSKNGVYVNSERVKECFLANGDIVAVGNAKFRYEERPKRDS